MKLYKLTNENDQTYNHTQWGEDFTHTASGMGELCGHGWIHAYTDPLLAVFLNPIHANFRNPHLWEAEGEVGKKDHGLKVGVKRLTTIRRIEIPTVTRTQKIAFGILCAKEVYKDEKWNAWADGWLSGKDRSKKSAASEEWAAWAAAAAAEELDFTSIIAAAMNY